MIRNDTQYKNNKSSCVNKFYYSIRILQVIKFKLIMVRTKKVDKILPKAIYKKIIDNRIISTKGKYIVIITFVIED